VIFATTFDLASVGYHQSEFMISGTARSFVPTGRLSSDGRWNVKPASSAPFATRAVVYAPIDRRRFDGTVFVEWLNVSGGVDAAPDWLLAHNEMIRRGAAWIGVSAQQSGLDATKGGDPVRYAALNHPGDSFSYDMFTQVGRAVRNQSATMLAGLAKPKRVIAIGESQSAFRLVTYINAIQPVAHAYDGFLVHSRWDDGAALSQYPQRSVETPSPSRIRSDSNVPTLVFETETDLRVSSLRARQRESRNLREWEVAGTAHGDIYQVGIGWTDIGDGGGAAAMMTALRHPKAQPIPGIIDCTLPVNSGPQHWVLQAALHALARWVRTGVAPRSAPRLEVASRAPVVVFRRDRDGNVIGGVRSPQVDAPIATITGDQNSGSSFCSLFGTTTPFTVARVRQLYPTNAAFADAWAEAATRAKNHGWLTLDDATELTAAAATFDPTS
jgi:Alpha/beta hydrolase domain